MRLLTDQYQDKIKGVLGCFDRVVIKGTLQGISYPEGMALFLRSRHIQIFDYPKLAETLTVKVRANAENLSREHGVEINYISRSRVSKESIAASVLREKEKEFGHGVSGLFCIISAVESCPSFYPTRLPNGCYTLKFKERQCLHYYFYIMDEVFGLCYFRVSTWLPFRLQFYFNGHNWLSKRLDEAGIAYTKIDNAYVNIADVKEAQQLSDSFNVQELHHKLDSLAQLYCPDFQYFGRSYHWTVMQAEYATDIIFKRQKDLGPIYSGLISTAVHTVKPDNIATFLGHSVKGNFQGEAGNNYRVRREGSRIKHTLKSTSIKMYDKFGQIIRIETTANDISFFKHYRKVDHNDGTTSTQFTSMKKSIYSFGPLMKVMKDSNRRYLEFISAIEDRSAGVKRLNKLSQRVEKNQRGYKGINFFDEQDLKLIEILNRGEFNISGFRNKDIRTHLKGKNAAQISRLLKRLKVHGIIKRAQNSYKYYLTKLGRCATLAGMKARELLIIPALNM